MRKGLKIILVVILIILLLGTYLIYNIRQDTAKIEISPVNISEVDDGKYTGTYAMGPVVAETLTEIKDGKIIGIQLVKHQHGLGKEGENVIEEVVNQQSLAVDTISGATTSSKVILKSIEMGLKEEK